MGEAGEICEDVESSAIEIEVQVVTFSYGTLQHDAAPVVLLKFILWHFYAIQ